MFYRMTNTIKKIFIMEIQDILRDHPAFYNTLVINKFMDKEREKKQIVVRSASSAKHRISMNDYVSNVISYSTLANFQGKRGDALEWVRDDIKNIEYLAPAGFYVVIMDEEDKFSVEQYIKHGEYIVIDQIMNSQKIAILEKQNLNLGSELITDIKGLRLIKDTHYEIDYTIGKITFLVDPDSYIDLQITYQYIGGVKGPFDVIPFTINNEAIPGIVLAFGDRLRKGDMQLIAISERRDDSARAYGGLWDVSLDITIYAQDTDQLERLADFVADSLWDVDRKEKFVDRGISILDIGLSGESEELELDIPDEYVFMNSLSLSMQVEWEIHKPILGTIEQISINKPVDTGLYSDEELDEYQNSLKKNINLDFFGTVEDARRGRGHDVGEGSQHFAGLVPIVNPEAITIRPSIFT